LVRYARSFFIGAKHEGRSKPTIGPVQFLDRVIKLYEQGRALSLACHSVRCVDAENSRALLGKWDLSDQRSRLVKTSKDQYRRSGRLNLHYLSALDISCRIEVQTSLTPTAPPPAIIS